MARRMAASQAREKTAPPAGGCRGCLSGWYDLLSAIGRWLVTHGRHGSTLGGCRAEGASRVLHLS
jgi:hypothetical protein